MHANDERYHVTLHTHDLHNERLRAWHLPGEAVGARSGREVDRDWRLEAHLGRISAL